MLWQTEDLFVLGLNNYVLIANAIDEADQGKKITVRDVPKRILLPQISKLNCMFLSVPLNS